MVSWCTPISSDHWILFLKNLSKEFSVNQNGYNYNEYNSEIIITMRKTAIMIFMLWKYFLGFEISVRCKLFFKLGLNKIFFFFIFVKKYELYSVIISLKD